MAGILTDAGVSRETLDRLRQYQALLHKWQQKINLVSSTTVSDSWNRHFEDSLQLLPLIPQGVKSLYDLGSGAGFPGLVIAVARPDISVTLIESDAKKCAFLQAVSRETGVAISVRNVRIEAAVKDLPPPDMVSARALASLDALFGYVRPWAETASNMALLFPKGENWRAEIAAAEQAGWAFELADCASKSERNARLLLFKTLRKTSV